MSSTALTTVITASGTRYEIDEAYGQPIVRRHAPVSGPDGLEFEWPDGVTMAVHEVDLIDHPRATMNGGECALRIRMPDGRDVLTSPIMSITDGVTGWCPLG